MVKSDCVSGSQVTGLQQRGTVAFFANFLPLTLEGSRCCRMQSNAAALRCLPYCEDCPVRFAATEVGVTGKEEW